MTPIVIYPSDVLRKVCSPVESIKEARKIRKLLEESLSMCRYGAGLAAPQIGLGLRLHR